MTLTEEQREAIKYAISSLEQCGSEPEDPVVAKILGAMIDSSDQFGDATKLIGFDLERARGLRDSLQDDCAEVGDVWAEMIAEIERLREKVHQRADRIAELEAEVKRLSQPNACDDWGNPVVLGVSGGVNEP